MRAGFAGVEIDVPAGWLDITDDLDDDPPPTLAREDGVGAIQFSIAWYESGALPGIDEVALQQMLWSRFGSPTVTEQTCPHLVVGTDTMMEDNRLGAWYVSDGASVAFVTYVGEATDPASAGELADARGIACSLRFPGTP
ncbi:hypothetical protein OF829_16370 [Sphingomonas sp. LB-2]|uniref:hypothetical protein n=1 Tax=Sphingomonas caeni TaxID=2984949 RepID=UPI00222F54E8|nr:hypothetical protein [Sphingomonas caeni]MCW3848814.1 hypothetical protein [Sphingomonas caeni]